MRTLVNMFALAVLAALAIGCDKKDKGGGGVHAVTPRPPNACYNQGQSPRYQMINGQCIDMQQGRPVQNISACQNVQQHYSYNPNCNYYGGYPYWNGPVNQAHNACSVYNTEYEVFYPVHYPNLGITVCAGFTAFNFFYMYGMPMYYPGYANVFQGCVPGSQNNGCHCRSFGGTLGWFHAGATLGVCY